MTHFGSWANWPTFFHATISKLIATSSSLNA